MGRYRTISCGFVGLDVAMGRLDWMCRGSLSRLDPPGQGDGWHEGPSHRGRRQGWRFGTSTSPILN
eukprot:scaffold324_cov326-Pavlova_lutheri.AAC.86